MDNRVPYLTLYLIVVLILTVPSGAQKFNAFKSYKDAAVKPANYGRVERRNFPIEEYLSGNQMKMMRSRRGADRSEDMFDNSWSGFKQYKENRAAGKTVLPSTASSNDYNWRRLIEAPEEIVSTTESWNLDERWTAVRLHVETSLHFYLFAAVLTTFGLVCYMILCMTSDNSSTKRILPFSGEKFVGMSINRSPGRAQIV